MELKLMYSKGEILVHESCILNLEDLSMQWHRKHRCTYDNSILGICCIDLEIIVYCMFTSYSYSL